MPISLEALSRVLQPSKTALLIGAGACVPSGAPTGPQLAAELWKRVAGIEPASDDLKETATILQRRYSRRAVVDVVVKILSPLQPTGGILGLPQLGWEKIFSTNFDKIIELAYAKQGVPLVPIRSNYDFSSKETSGGTRLFKIHGCISQDESRGDRASMTLTDYDYETHKKYRQLLFAQLTSTLLEGDVLIIGQSLRDPHLNELIREVISGKQQGAPGHVYALIYEADEYRAPLLEDIGLRIAFGNIDALVHSLASKTEDTVDVAASASSVLLPLSLVSTALDISAEGHKSPNAFRMFNGGPASYADIAAQCTFERGPQLETVNAILDGLRFVTILGAAGVGKTTFARQLAASIQTNAIPVWEHKADFPFQAKPWIALEANLRSEGRAAVLVLDECTHFLRQANMLVDHLSEIDQPALRLILTANSAAWAPRLKSPNLFSKGKMLELSRLEVAELNSLITLLERKPEIAQLAQGSFKSMTRQEQMASLRQKCSADMFVCLKNIFANESLDIILLQEYDDLEEPVQDLYRYVAALEAVGTKVHRQLMIRMLGIASDTVKAVLQQMSGIIDEYDIDTKIGIYGWRTRHLVIARKITEYKFSGLDELTKLFQTIIENINPSVPLELQTVREICDSEYGIGRLGDPQTKQRLYKALIAIAPGERIPWHRLIRELLRAGDYEAAENVIRNAEQAVGGDAPLDRFKVRLLVTRAQKTTGISDGDRVALLRRAYELAMNNVSHHKWDKYSYYTLCDVAVQLVQRGESAYILQEALSHAQAAAERILDPEMPGRLREYEAQRIRAG